MPDVKIRLAFALMFIVGRVVVPSENQISKKSGRGYGVGHTPLVETGSHIELIRVFGILPDMG